MFQVVENTGLVAMPTNSKRFRKKGLRSDIAAEADGCYLSAMQNILLIAVFGATGAIARYATSGWAQRLCGDGFPYGTLIVNVLGCFLLGIVQHLATQSTAFPELWRNALAIGFLGAFTTFSTFGYETVKHLEAGNWSVALGSTSANLALGFAAVWAGLALARLLTSSP